MSAQKAALLDIRFPAWWGWLAVGTAASIPLVDVGSDAFALAFLEKRQLHVALFDPLVWGAAAMLAGLVLVRRDVRACAAALAKEWLVCVWPALLLLLVSAISLTQIRAFDAKALKLVAKHAIQWTEYLVVAPLVFLPLLLRRPWRGRLFWGLCITTTLAVVSVALRTPLGKVFAGEIHPYRVGGLLGNRNTYGCFMAVGLCLLAGWAHEESRVQRNDPGRVRWLLIPAALLPLLAVYPCLAAGPLVGLLAGLTVTYVAGRRAGVLIPFVLVGFLLLVDGGEHRAKRMRVLANSIQTFRPHKRPGELMKRSRPTMRALRWAANTNMIREHPLLGVGWGQYQRHVGEYYGDLPVPEGSTDRVELYDLETHEELSFSWFYVTAGESGLLGLSAVFVLLAACMARALGAHGAVRCLGAPGVLGAAVALLVVGLWTDPLTRGVGPLVGLLVAMSAVPGEAGMEAGAEASDLSSGDAPSPVEAAAAAVRTDSGPDVEEKT